MASMAMTIGSGVANIAAQSQAAKAQAKAQMQASLNETKRHQHAMSSERLRQSQEETTSALEALKANREATEGMATTIVAGEESGVSGNAVGLAVAEFAKKNADYQVALSIQERMNNASRIMAFEGGGLQYQQNLTRINKPIKQPDVLGTLLSTGQQVLGQYQAGQMRGLQRDNLTAQNQLLGQQYQTGLMSLQNFRAGTANALLSRNLMQERTRTTISQRRHYDAMRLGN